MATARVQKKIEEKVSDRTPVKVKIKRIEEKTRASGAIGKGRGTPGRKKAKEKLLSPRQKKIKDFFEHKLQKAGGTGLSRDSKANYNK